MKYATEIWATEIESDVDIRIVASTFPGCPFSGFAAVGSVVRDFLNAPLPNTWYPVALANKLAGVDLCPPGSCASSDDMTVVLGRDCGHYLGLDADPLFIDLARTAIHEIGHGLGFTTPMNPGNGQRLMSLDDVYSNHLEDHSTGLTFPQMTDAERAAAAVNTGNLHWVGPHVVATSHTYLTAGVDVNGHVEMYAPPVIQLGSTVYHFSTSLIPYQVLAATSWNTPDHDIGLAREVFRDLGWFLPAEGTCPTSPAPGCAEGFSRRKLLVDERVAGREKVIATLAGGPPLAQGDFGNPLAADGTGYDVCLYDDGGHLAGQLTVDRAGETTCSGAAPCWRSIGGLPPAGRGYRYVDGEAASGGVHTMQLKGGGSSRIILKASGPAPPLPGGIAAALSSTTSVTVQLHRQDGPGCMSATLDRVVRQETQRFQAR